MFIIMIVVLGLFVAGIVTTIFITLRKTDPKTKDSSANPNIKTAQEFLPFESIGDDVICLGGQRYRAIIECSSVNYRLKTEGEREQIERSFQRFLGTITFPITFFLQTKTIDNTKRLSLLKEEIKDTLVNYPGMRSYADQYLRDMGELNVKVGNSQQKKRYIIVTYDDAALLDGLSDEEKARFAAKEIRNRCNMLSSGLDGCGIKSRMLDTQHLFELIYSCYHRKNYSYSEAIASKEAFSLFVNGDKDRFTAMSHESLLDLILGESINKIEMSNFADDVSGESVARELKQLREKYTGHGRKEETRHE